MEGMNLFGDKPKRELTFDSTQIVTQVDIELMLFDSVVAVFRNEQNINGSFYIREVLDYSKLPFMIKNNVDKFDTWLRDRPIQTNRQHIDAIIDSLGINFKNPVEVLLINNGLSLNDAYWIRHKGSNLKWKDINLYSNSFKDSLGFVTFFGERSSFGGNLCTPEITTGGSVGKAWREVNSKKVLYKKDNLGTESFTELVASKIAKLIGLDHIEYSIGEWRDKTCSVCDLYTTEDIGYPTMHQYLEGVGISVNDISVANYLNKVPNTRHITDMLVFDFIIENRDRHFSNFGFTIDNATQTITGTFPIFDNGYALFNDKSHKVLLHLNYSVYSEVGTFRLTNMEQLKNLPVGLDKYKQWANIILDNIDYITPKFPNIRVVN